MNLTEIFAKDVFSTEQIKQRLTEKLYKEFEYCTTHSTPLAPYVADAVANAMKEWAMGKGVTHYSHWFQPLNGITAQKHDSLLDYDGANAITKLSGNALIKGEPDASSLPNGGLRSTFEARGYTTWDPLSPAFIRRNVLYIPTAFCSYNGEALDKKTPLLRSLFAIDKSGTKLSNMLGKKTSKICVNVGAEQEYFLIDKDMYKKRRDILLTGRALFGAKPPKCQEMQDHYLGSIKPRIEAFMQEVDLRLWKVGIPAKTRHNEVAPCQYEFAPLHTAVNIACDQNQLIMETLKEIADEHGLVCLLHEKPFPYVNGSGKHNNWSLSTDDGQNLFECGDNIPSNYLFLASLCAVICSTAEHQDLLRIACASASNDMRLGADEAPPAIVSIYLGKELTGILQAIADGREYSKRAHCNVRLGVDILPKIPPDSADRNRTSPFAYTGNKFEFRMCGSSQSIADINICLNTIVAEQFCNFADILKSANSVESGISQIVKHTMATHGGIIFNGNNYSKDWQTQAKERGLLNIKTSPQAMQSMTNEKNVKLFLEQGVFSKSELLSRQIVSLDNYCNTSLIEAKTMLDIAIKDILPYALEYKLRLAKLLKKSKSANLDSACESEISQKLCKLISALKTTTSDVENIVIMSENMPCVKEKSCYICDELLPRMNKLKSICDSLENIIPRSIWSMPTLTDILYCND